MNSEMHSLLTDQRGEGDTNVVKIVMMGLGVGKRTIAGGLKERWSEIRREGRRGESGDDLGIRGRELTVETIESAGRCLPYIQPIPSGDVFILVYSILSDDTYKAAHNIRKHILQQKGTGVPIVFAASMKDIADRACRDATERVYRDLFISCELEHGHYEMSGLNKCDINFLLESTMKRINKNDPSCDDSRVSQGNRVAKFKTFFSGLFK